MIAEIIGIAALVLLLCTPPPRRKRPTRIIWQKVSPKEAGGISPMPPPASPHEFFDFGDGRL